jgi:diguanylate cyclase (GGDEF)-like protein
MDQLTGLLTRNDLRATLSKLQDFASGVTAIFFDIDGMIWVNDEWGHIEGDRVIAAVAGWLKSTVEKHNGTAFRVGGDEFLFLLPHTSPQDAMRIAKQTVSECETLRIPYPPKTEEMMHFFGDRYDSRDFLALNAVVLTVPSGDSDIKPLLEACELAIYQTIKTEGRKHSIVSRLLD